MGRHKIEKDEPSPAELKKAEKQALKMQKRYEKDLADIRKGLFVHDQYDDD